MVNWQSLLPTIYYQEDTTTSSKVILVNDITLASGVDTVYDLPVTNFIDGIVITETDNTQTITEIGEVSNQNKNVVTDYSTGATTSGAENTPVNFSHFYRIHGVDNLEVNYYTSTTAPSIKDVPVELKVYIGTSDNDKNVIVDVTISNDIRYTFDADVFCTNTGPVANLDFDVDVIKGVIHYLTTDILSSSVNVESIILSIFSTEQTRDSVDFEAEVVPGGIQSFNTDIFSTKSVISEPSIGFDIRVASLSISDFFLDAEEFKLATVTAWADVTDPLWDIDVNNTYFMVDDTIVSGTTNSGIANGYRFYYNPPEDYNHDEVFTYTIHAQNVLGDVLERDYNLLYGYDVNYTDLVDWGPNKKVDILARAANKAYCVNTEAESFYFVTRDLEGYNLGATIKPTAPVDLSSEIRTQGKVFYYGGTYQVTVSGIKDYSGNELAPITYSFTIENPIN